MKLGPIGACLVRAGFFFVVGKSKSALFSTVCSVFQLAEKALDLKPCGPDAPTLASLRDHVRHGIFDREERTDQIDAQDFLPMIDGLNVRSRRRALPGLGVC
jgi:hypothetical protein